MTDKTDSNERAAFEAWIKNDCGDLSTFGSGTHQHYRNSAVNNAWIAWKARASLSANAAAITSETGNSASAQGAAITSESLSANAGEPMAYLIDWPDEPELGHYFSEFPSDSGRCRPLYLAAPPTAQAEVENLRKALQFYADKEHFAIAEDDAWDTVSGEQQNYWFDEAGTAMVEDGSIAKLALEGRPIRFEDDDSALPPAPSTEGESNG